MVNDIYRLNFASYNSSFASLIFRRPESSAERKELFLPAAASCSFGVRNLSYYIGSISFEKLISCNDISGSSCEATIIYIAIILYDSHSLHNTMLYLCVLLFYFTATGHGGVMSCFVFFLLLNRSVSLITTKF